MKKQIFTFWACMLWMALLKAQPTLIKEISTVSTHFTEAGNLIYFTSHDSLFVSDGTTGGTVLIKSGLNNPGQFTGSNGMLYFVISGNQLWRSNGTNEGTVQLKIFSNGEINYINTVGPYLYFTARESGTGRELYRTNGTVAGTILLKDINPGSGDGVENDHYLVHNDYLYFPGTNSATGTELWRTDGTTSGTILLKDVWPGSASGYVYGSWSAGGMVYFAANDGVHGVELWITNGTSSGTHLVRDVNPGTANGFSSGTIVSISNIVYFFANKTNTSFELWKTDGTDTGTLLVKEIDMVNEFSWGQNFLYTNNNFAYFYTYDNQISQIKLWKTDGTSVGTEAYYSIQNDFEQFQFHTVLNSKYFGVLIPSSDRASLLVTDGTTEGTFTEEVLYTGETTVFDFAVVNNHVVFGAYGQNSAFIGYFKSDGTPGGTSIFYSRGFPSPEDLVVVGNHIFFVQDLVYDEYGLVILDDYRQLLISDLEDTYIVRDYYGISFAGSRNLINVNDDLYFTTYNDYGWIRTDPPSSDQTIKRLWKFDPSLNTCVSEGGILRQVWNNIPSYNISGIPLNSVVPYITDTLDIFEGPSDIGDDYGARYRGYICAPETGAYTFWTASDDKSELWLSTDALPKNKVKIAYVDTYTNSREWDKFSIQQSAPVNLVAGRRYYIEALHKENAGRDNFAVGWQLPGGILERPIPGSRLSPFVNMSPGIKFNHPADHQTFIDPDYISLEVNAIDWDGNILKVEYYVDNIKIGENTVAPFNLNWSAMAPGLHILMAKAYDNEGGVGTTSINVNIQHAVTDGSFTLVNADTDQDIRFMADGEIVYLSGYNINIRYNATEHPASVKFLLNGAPFSAENVAPYTLVGDQNGDYRPWTDVSVGSYTLEARETTGASGTGNVLKSTIIHFEVVEYSGNLPPVVNAGPNQVIHLPQNSVNLNGSAFDQDGNIVSTYWNRISVPPGAPLDIPVLVEPSNPQATANYLTVPGTYIFRLSVTDNLGLWTSDDVSITVTSPTSFVISHFSWVNAETNELIYSMYPGQNVDFPPFLNYKLNVVAHTYPSDVGSVHFNFDGYLSTENVPPYSLFGDIDGDYNSLPISAGSHTLVATPYSGPNMTGVQGPPLSVTFNMAHSSARVATIEGRGNPGQHVFTCFPNPSSDFFEIQLNTSEPEYVVAEIFDGIGRLKGKLFEGYTEAGNYHNLTWKPEINQRGLYILRLKAGDKQYTEKLILK